MVIALDARAWTPRASGLQLTDPRYKNPDGTLIKMRCGTSDVYANVASVQAVLKNTSGTGFYAYLQLVETSQNGPIVYVPPGGQTMATLDMSGCGGCPGGCAGPGSYNLRAWACDKQEYVCSTGSGAESNWCQFTVGPLTPKVSLFSVTYHDKTGTHKPADIMDPTAPPDRFTVDVMNGGCADDVLTIAIMTSPAEQTIYSQNFGVLTAGSRQTSTLPTPGGFPTCPTGPPLCRGWPPFTGLNASTPGTDNFTLIISLGNQRYSITLTRGVRAPPLPDLNQLPGNLIGTVGGIVNNPIGTVGGIVGGVGGVVGGAVPKIIPPPPPGEPLYGATVFLTVPWGSIPVIAQQVNAGVLNGAYVRFTSPSTQSEPYAYIIVHTLPGIIPNPTKDPSIRAQNSSNYNSYFTTWLTSTQIFLNQIVVKATILKTSQPDIAFTTIHINNDNDVRGYSDYGYDTLNILKMRAYTGDGPIGQFVAAHFDAGLPTNNPTPQPNLIFAHVEGGGGSDTDNCLENGSNHADMMYYGSLSKNGPFGFKNGFRAPYYFVNVTAEGTDKSNPCYHSGPSAIVALQYFVGGLSASARVLSYPAIGFGGGYADQVASALTTYTRKGQLLAVISTGNATQHGGDYNSKWGPNDFIRGCWGSDYDEVRKRFIIAGGCCPNGFADVGNTEVLTLPMDATRPIFFILAPSLGDLYHDDNANLCCTGGSSNAASQLGPLLVVGGGGKFGKIDNLAPLLAASCPIARNNAWQPFAGTHAFDAAQCINNGVPPVAFGGGPSTDALSTIHGYGKPDAFVFVQNCDKEPLTHDVGADRGAKYIDVMNDTNNVIIGVKAKMVSKEGFNVGGSTDNLVAHSSTNVFVRAIRSVGNDLQLNVSFMPMQRVLDDGSLGKPAWINSVFNGVTNDAYAPQGTKVGGVNRLWLDSQVFTYDPAIGGFVLHNNYSYSPFFGIRSVTGDPLNGWNHAGRCGYYVAVTV